MYPFGPGAKALLEEGVSEADVNDALAYLQEPLSDAILQNDGRHVKLYALSKAILSCASDFAKRKYAAKKAREYVKDANTSGQLLGVAQWFFPSIRETDNGFALNVGDYLRTGENLVQQGVSGGIVSISGQELNRLLSKSIQEKFMDTPPAQSVPDLLREKAALLEEALPAPKKGNLRFIELGCIRRVREGIGEGKRFYGAMALSIALAKDGVAKNEADAAMADYVARCSGTKPFSPTEGQSTLDWVYGKGIGFSCKRMMDDGFEGTYCQTCPINWKRKRN